MDTKIDFIGKSQCAAEAEVETQSGLCCCEYINKDNEHFHILGCCCNCENFDLLFTRLITCRRVESRHRSDMLLTFQDRLRIPWRGGAKQISFDAILPAFLIPLMISIAAINEYACDVIFVLGFVSIAYALRYVQRRHSRTRFFFMWIFWSIIYMVVLFEFKVPLLELLPEENLILVMLSTASLYCFWRTRQRAALNHVVQSTVAEDELPDITEATAAEEEEEASQTTLLLEHDPSDSMTTSASNSSQPNICGSCRKYVPSRTAHCSVCGACIMRRDHHSFWLDCCIGEWNHAYYLSGLLLAEAALLLGTNLTLTAVCHPYLVVRLLGVPIMLPDDCSEVFDMYELGLSFVIAVYASFIGVYMLFILMRQLYVISRGMTLQECKRGGGVTGHRSNQRSIIMNWRAFLLR